MWVNTIQYIFIHCKYTIDQIKKFIIDKYEKLNLYYVCLKGEMKNERIPYSLLNFWFQ